MTWAPTSRRRNGTWRRMMNGKKDKIKHEGIVSELYKKKGEIVIIGA